MKFTIPGSGISQSKTAKTTQYSVILILFPSRDQQSEKGPKRGRDRDKGRKDGQRGRGRTKEFVQTTGALFGEGTYGIGVALTLLELVYSELLSL